MVDIGYFYGRGACPLKQKCNGWTKNDTACQLMAVEVHTYLVDVQSLRTSILSILFLRRPNKMDAETYYKR